jgi:methylated-DNA-[protein]-cysteine S-methyltransferase
MFVAFVTFDAANGACGLAWTDTGLTRVRPFEPSRAMAASRLQTNAGTEAGETQLPAMIAGVIEALRRFLSGEPATFDDTPLDMGGLSDFDSSIYAALRAVGWGETVTYGELARRIGEPASAARAVGAEMGRNPLPLVVPCHRVLASGGKLGGFSAPGGGRTKRVLLTREGVHLDGGQLALFE